VPPGGPVVKPEERANFRVNNQGVHSLRKLVERGLTVGGENATPSGVPATGGYGEANQREMAPRREGGSITGRLAAKPQARVWFRDLPGLSARVE
jgi:hypothetical protein